MTSSTEHSEKSAAPSATLVPMERIESRIYFIRGEKVMLDSDLAELYGVTTGALNRAVQRNVERFPSDFMFQLTVEEFENLKCQIGISSYGGRRFLPYLFTEQGVAMLSGLLKSPRAIAVNVGIMRAFVRLRQMIVSNADLGRKLAELEKNYDEQFKIVFDAIRELMAPLAPGKKGEVGFHTGIPALRSRAAKAKPSKAKV